MVYKGCDCPKYFRGRHNGKTWPRTNLRETTWEGAEAALTKIKNGEQSQKAQVSVQRAIEDWHTELALDGVAPITNVLRRIVTKKLLNFCERNRIATVNGISPAMINKWRAEWTVEKVYNRDRIGIAPGTAKDRLTILKLFLKFLRRMGWITEDPMTFVSLKKRKPEGEKEENQTLPLDLEGDSNYQSLLKAIPKYLGSGFKKKKGAMATHPENLVAMTELMYETGLRVSDAILFQIDDVEIDHDGWGSYTTRQVKTKQAVTVGVPPELLKRLARLTRLSPKYVFFDGSAISTTSIGPKFGIT